MLNGEWADLLLGANGQDGSIYLFPKTATSVGDLAQANIVLAAETGDITLKSADCAEEFDVADAAAVRPGSVMVLDRGGQVRESCDAYDTRVVGVISGAGGYRPGIVLDRDAARTGRASVALMGKVFCQADAEESPIDAGDLLTTSSLTGHAMKATDPARAFGAVLGKALAPLEGGQGLIPVLVSLQ